MELIFRPGFSTAAQVTDVSGRGIGMDVVRSHVERAGGRVEISTQLGRGTRIRLMLPLTMAVIPAMLVGTGAHAFAIAQPSIVELIGITPETLEQVGRALVYRLRGQVLPLVHLDALLALAHTDPGERINVVVLRAHGQTFGLAVDRIDNAEDIVIKPLDGALKRLGVYAGAATLSDGSVALVLDAAGLATRAGLSTKQQHDDVLATPQQQSGATALVLTFRAGADTLCAVPLGLIARLEEVPTHAIERIAQRETLQYRGNLLPIVRPETLMPLGATPVQAVQPVIVVDVGHLVGIAVSEILDVIEVPEQQASAQSDLPYVLEQRIFGSRTTLVLDAARLAADGQGASR